MIDVGDLFCVKGRPEITGRCTKIEQRRHPDAPRIIYGLLDRPLGGPDGPKEFYAPEESLELVKKMG